MNTRRVYIIAAVLLALVAGGFGFKALKNYSGGSSSSSSSGSVGGGGGGGSSGPTLIFAPVAALPPATTTPTAPAPRARTMSARSAPEGGGGVVRAQAVDAPLVIDAPSAGPIVLPEVLPTQQSFAGEVPTGWGGSPSATPTEGAAPQTFSGVTFSSTSAVSIINVVLGDTRNGIPRVPPIVIPPSPVSEPNLWLLLLCGLGAMIFKARRAK